MAVVAVFDAALPRAAAATTCTFDTAAVLDAAFGTDVMGGDNKMICRARYGADHGFPASHAGFADINRFNTANALRSSTDPATLLQMATGCRWSAGGHEVRASNFAAADNRLTLHDALGSLLSNKVPWGRHAGAYGDRSRWGRGRRRDAHVQTQQ